MAYWGHRGLVRAFNCTLTAWEAVLLRIRFSFDCRLANIYIYIIERCHADDVIDGFVTSGSSGGAASMYPGRVPLDGSSYVDNVMHTFYTCAGDVVTGCGNRSGRIGSTGILSNGHGA